MRHLRDVPVTRRTALGIVASIAPASLLGRLDAIGRRLAIPQGQQSDTELLEMSARDVVARIRSGDLSAEAYVSRLLQQHESYKDLNLVNTIDGERVREAARAVDVTRKRSGKLGAAAGLPFAVKDQISVAGYPTSAGNAALKGYVPKRNATVVEQLVRSGAMAPRLGAAALNIPAGLSNGLPVGLQFDSLPGHDSELLGLGIAVEKVLGRLPPPNGPR